MAPILLITDGSSRELGAVVTAAAGRRRVLIASRASALDAARAHAHSVAVLHVGPAPDVAWSLLARLKAAEHPSIAQLPVVMVGPPGELMRIRAMIEGAVGYLAEPVEPDQLAEQIDAVLASGLAEPVLRKAAQRAALQELAALEQRGHLHGTGAGSFSPDAGKHDSRSAGTADAPPAAEAPTVLPDEALDKLSAMQRAVILALSTGASDAEAARSLDLSATRISGHLRAIARRVKLPPEDLARLAREGRLLGPIQASHLRLSSELEQAMENNELVLDYQPIMSLTGERVARAEALLRWRHPRRGLLPPKEFIPHVEAGEVMWSITRWVLEQACAQLRAWKDELRRDDLQLAINIPAGQAGRVRLRRLVADVVGQLGIEPGRLILDIPASSLVGTGTRAVTFKALRALGVRIAADDFASSSPASLKTFAVDTVKIDSGFVAGLGRTSVDTAIINAAIGLADSLGLESHAKGVETQDQLDLLTSLGCRFAQGFRIAPPMPATRLASLLA